MECSLVLCTHNPRADYLRETLEALQAQSVPRNAWELIVIDNASDPAVSAALIDWHPHGRVVREERLGLTNARLAGIREAAADLLIFVDDDNVLDREYVATALKIARDYPYLGAFGGAALPRFEVTPPEWTRPHWHWLAIKNVRDIKWSNFRDTNQTLPVGAGMCVKRVVAEAYSKAVNADPLRKQLDRRGDQLSSCGDTDLALTACDVGLGTGLFPALTLVHLIPPARLEESYLLNLVESVERSSVLLRALRAQALHPRSRRSTARQLLGKIRRRIRMAKRDRKFFEARMRGIDGAMKQLELVARSNSELPA